MEFATTAQQPVLLALPLQPAPPAGQTLPKIMVHVYVKAFLRLPKNAHSAKQEPTTMPITALATNALLKRPNVPLVTLNLAFARCAHQLIT